MLVKTKQNQNESQYTIKKINPLMPEFIYNYIEKLIICVYVFKLVLSKCRSVMQIYDYRH